MTEISIPVNYWLTPNFVTVQSLPGKRQDGISEGPKYPLNAVDAEVLSAMCDEFRREIFEKAGKPDPKVRR